jgi:hypothetical protein
MSTGENPGAYMRANYFVTHTPEFSHDYNQETKNNQETNILSIYPLWYVLGSYIVIQSIMLINGTSYYHATKRHQRILIIICKIFLGLDLTVAT